MKTLKKKTLCVAVSLFCAAQLFGGERACALESDELPAEEKGEEVVAVDLPTVNEDEESPFDFFIDPQGLLYSTGAAAHGGGTVEDDAHLLFHNRNGEDYDFSRSSDRLSVTNRGTVPVIVTITARITDAGTLSISQDKEFAGEESCAIYLALADDDGNEQPISKDGEVSLCARLEAAPEDADAYDTYSFGLTGECNTHADWDGAKVHPVIKITWKVEPVIAEDEDPEEEIPAEDADEGEEISADSVDAEEEAAADDANGEGRD